MDKVFVGRQKRQFVPDAEPREHGVDGASLQTAAAAAIAQFRGIDVILSVQREERHGREPLRIHEALNAGR